MKETIKINEVLPDREQAILDTALLESDQLLARSLHDDQRRRRRRYWLLASVFGGVVMSVLILAFLLGVFSLGVPDVAEAKGKRPTHEAIEQAEAFSAEGWQLWRKQDHLAAATKFEKSVELNPKAANAWNGYGWALFNSGQSTKALRAFERCVKLSPKHPAALNGLGQLYLSRGEYKQAEKWLKKSAKNPQASAAWHGLARVYLLTGEHKKALPWAKKVAAVGSANDFSKQMLAAAKTGELSDELRQMLEPITAQQGEEGTKSDSAVPIEKTGDESFESIKEKRGISFPKLPFGFHKAPPKVEWAYGPDAIDEVAKTAPTKKDDFKRAWQMFFGQKYKTSERLFLRVLETEPENPHAMNGLGWSLLNQDQHAQAKRFLQESLKLKPEHWGAMTGLGVCLRKEGNLDEAVKLFERIEQNVEGENSATEYLAEIYLERRQYRKSLEQYEKLVKLHPKATVFREGLSKAKAGLAKQAK